MTVIDGSKSRIEDGDPKCGEDFCDDCGDCLHCFWEDPCRDGGRHSWVIYEEEDEQC